MRRFFKAFAFLPLALFIWAAYSILSAPAEPAFGAPNRGQVIAQLNHIYTVASYAVVWAIQLGYVAWLGLRWVAQKQQASRFAR